MVRELLACGFDEHALVVVVTPLEVAQASAGREAARAAYVAVQADEAAARRLGGAARDARLPPRAQRKLGLHVLGVGVGALLSRFLPSDEYTLWKRGARLRADAGLIGLDAKALSWRRGVVSFLSRFDHAPQTPELVMVNHQTRRAAPYLRTWAFLEPSAGLPPDDAERLLESGLARHTPRRSASPPSASTAAAAAAARWRPSHRLAATPSIRSRCAGCRTAAAVTYAITLYERMLGPGAAGGTAAT